tara:strand:- start:1416 stop:2126 length:711 start_codon:yes stop_codon:yes gene_type:complete
MVSINEVYQKVLMFANKEQRGYITPQEFNMFADQAQREIFEQYFYDLNQFARVHGNSYVHSDIDQLLQEKMSVFEDGDSSATISTYAGGTTKTLPSYIYRVYRVEYNNILCELLNTNDFNDRISGGPLTGPTSTMPIANIKKNKIKAAINTTNFVTPTNILYFKNPSKPNWGYVVVNKKAMHNPNPSATTDFQLHKAEEVELVYKILKFAGISMKREDILGSAQLLEQSQVQQEKQ